MSINIVYIQSATLKKEGSDFVKSDKRQKVKGLHRHSYLSRVLKDEAAMDKQEAGGFWEKFGRCEAPGRVPRSDK